MRNKQGNAWPAIWLWNHSAFVAGSSCNLKPSSNTILALKPAGRVERVEDVSAFSVNFSGGLRLRAIQAAKQRVETHTRIGKVPFKAPAFSRARVRKMIELIIDAVKLIFSEDARKSASGLIDFVRRSPDWQKDICTLEATVDTGSREHAHLLSGLAAEKMKNLKYAARSVADFESVYQELIANAFEHGCKHKPNGKVSIRLETT